MKRQLRWFAGLAWTLAPALAAAEVDVPAGSDLGRVIRDNPDEEVFVLAAGAYAGFINISDRTVELRGAPGIGSVLTGDDQKLVIQVIDNGQLIATDIAFAPPSDGTAVLVKSGSASLNNCRFSPVAGRAVYVDDGELTLTDCRFEGLTGIGVLGFAKAQVVMTGGGFEGGGKDSIGIFVQQESRLSVKDALFRNSEGRAIYGAAKSRLSVADSRFVKLAQTAIAVTDGSEARVSSSGFEAMGRSAVHGAGNSILAVDRIRVDGSAGPAVQIDQGGRLTLFDAQFIRNRLALYAVSGEVDARIGRIEVREPQGEGVAVAVTSGGRIELTDSRFDGAGLSLKGQFAVPPLLRGNRIFGAPGTGIYAEVSPGLELRDNQIVGTQGLGLLLQATAKAVLVDNVISAAGEFGLFAQNGSTIASTNNMIYGAKQAVYLHRSAGSGSRSDGDIFVGGVGGRGALQYSPRAEKLNATLDDADRRKELLLAGKALSASPAESRDAALAAFIGLGRDAIGSARQLALVKLSARDMAGRSFVTKAKAAAADGTSWPAKNGILVLSPGRYTLTAPLLQTARTLTLAADQVQQLELPAPDLLRLEFGGKEAPKSYFLQFRPKTERQAALRGYRYAESQAAADLRRLIIYRKPGMSADRRDRGLEAARQALAAAIMGLPAAGDGASEAAKKLTHHAYAGVQILTVVGTAADARDIMRFSALVPAADRLAVQIAAAWIEARLGRLGDGVVAAALQAADIDDRLHAALALDFVGSPAGGDVIIGYLTEAPAPDPALAARAFHSLLGRRDRPVTDLARKWLNDIPDAALQLLAFGTEADAAAVAKHRYKGVMAARLAHLLQDPAQAGRILADGLIEGDPTGWNFRQAEEMLRFAALCHAARALPSPRRERALEGLRRQWVRVHARMNGRRHANVFGRWYMDMAMSHCVASAAAVRAMHEFQRVDSWPFPWMPERKQRRHLDFEPWSHVENHFERTMAGDPTALALATSRWWVGQRATWVSDSRPDGLQRQAVVMWRPSPPAGGLSIVAGLRAERVNDKLRLGIKLDLAGDRYGAPASGAVGVGGLDYDDHTGSAGRTLLSAVHLDRDGQTVPLRYLGVDGRGEFVYEAEDDGLDLAALWADLSFDMFGTRQRLSYPLFASELARRDRQPATSPAEDDLEKADRLAGAGEYLAALPLYKTALADLSNGAERYLEVATRYRDRFMMEDALALLEAGLAKAPDHAGLLYGTADARMATGDYAGAAALYDRQAVRAPDDPSPAWWAATNRLLAGDATAARGFYDSARGNFRRVQSLLFGYYAARLSGDVDTAAAAKTFADHVTALEEQGRKADGYAVYLRDLFAADTAGAMPRVVENSFRSCRRLVAYGIRWHGSEAAQRAFAAAAAACPPDLVQRHLARAAAGG